MNEVKWIKITTDIFDDEKILLIEELPDADSIIVVWFKLLCFAGRQNNSGVFMLNDRIAYTDKMLATIFRRKESTVQLALKTFEELGMIEIIDGVITIPNWGKHQNLDSLEKKAAYMRNYMKDYRQKQKQIASGGASKTNGKTNSKTNVSRTDIDIEEDIDIEIDKEKKISKRKEKQQPTREEVKEYAKSRNSNVDPDRFYDYFSEGNWIDSKGNPVKSWKQKFITWEKGDAERQNDRGVKPRNTVKQPGEYRGKDFFDDD